MSCTSTSALHRRRSWPRRSAASRFAAESEASHAQDRLSRPLHDCSADPAASAELRARVDRAREHVAGAGRRATPRRNGRDPQQGAADGRDPRAVARSAPDCRSGHRDRLRRQDVLRSARHRCRQHPRLCGEHGAGTRICADPCAAPERGRVSRGCDCRSLAAGGPVLLLRSSDPRPGGRAAGDHRRRRARATGRGTRPGVRHGADVRRPQGPQRAGSAVHPVERGAGNERHHHAALATHV